jgi:membrane peptidoglycan carboxypeptidase
MLAAAHRSYLDGPDTMAARRRIVTTYVNATPLSSRPQYGEVIGLGDGLWAWYGTPFADVLEALAAENRDDLARKAEVYKQVLSLVLAQRRPSYYLVDGRAALAEMTDHHLGLLAEGGVITPALRDAALRTALRFRPEPPQPEPKSFVSRKATEAVRVELLERLKAPSLYALDRYDLTVDTTLDAQTQKGVSDVLASLDDRKEVRKRGLNAANMIAGRNPASLVYSVVLHERGDGRNLVRVHADNLDKPFDINSGAKLILGSTAKLRTLATYLDIVSRLHERLLTLPHHRLRLLACAPCWKQPCNAATRPIPRKNSSPAAASILSIISARPMTIAQRPSRRPWSSR